MKLENRTELKEYRAECQKKQSADCRVLVCGGTGCLAGGSDKIYLGKTQCSCVNSGLAADTPQSRWHEPLTFFNCDRIVTL